MTGPGRYRAFISYSHQDAAFAERLHSKLENFRLKDHAGPKWPLRPMFLDRSELASSPDLSEVIDKALRQSDALIVVCSPAAAVSKWVNAEILLFKRLGRTAIYPIVIDGEPGSDTPGEACFPEALRYQIDAEGELTDIPVEPLAADARKRADGSDAFLKLAAGLLGVPFDSLKLRQQRRRVRQALGLAAGATAMLILTAYLAFTAMAARQDAEARRDQAEDLVSFMLGDLRERLQPVGRLDAMDGVGEKVLEYFSRLDEQDLTSEALLTRATALRQIGEVRVAQGRISEGLEAFDQAQALLEGPAGGNEPVRLFELGQVYFWIADAYFRDLELDKAETFIEKYLEVSRRLVELEPFNLDYQLELLYAESNLGTLAFRANDMDAASQYFENALTVGRRLASQQPSGDINYELADTISWLGAIEASRGNFGSALRWYEEELNLRRGLAAGDEPVPRHELGRTLWQLGAARQQAGRLDEAITALEESVRIYRELAAYDPLNFEWQRELAWTLTLLSRDRFATGQLTAEQALATLALAAEAMADATDDGSAEYARVTASIAIERAFVELVDGRPEVAAELAAGARDQLAPLSTSKDRIRILPVYARATYISAEAARAAGDTAGAITIAAVAMESFDVRDDDHVEVRAYVALIAFHAEHADAETLLASVAATEYGAPAYVPDSPASDWWRRQVN
jgi:tetratricopeptide (TPR) repeat protein